MNIQINKDNANVKNIGNQFNYCFIGFEGTPFVPSLECKEGKYYESVKNSLYYPPQYLDRVISVLEEEHSILIQGEQGSGKSILAFHIAERMKEQGIIVSAHYLNPPSDWIAIKQWIQSMHYQERGCRSEGAHLWIIDNLHRIPGAVEDFPDSSVWEHDFCVCCTRDLNGLPDENENWLQPVLSRKQIFKRNIDKKTFLKCYHALTGNRIGRHESDYLYQYIGGNLAMLRYVTKSGNLPKSLIDWRNEQFIDFNNIYMNYFGFGAAGRITRDNLNDVLKMLFLSQIDFSIPFYLQLNVCQTVLKDLYFETSDMELEMEHATLAELLTACICSKYKLNDRNVFTECLHWTLSNLADSRLNELEQLRQINVFLRSLCCYKFILNQNQTLYEVILYDKCFLNFLENNKGIISLSVWKMIMKIVEGNSDVNAIFHDFAKSPLLLDTMKLNSDYDFRFFRSRLSQDELEKVETMLLFHTEAIMKYILDSENEACFMHLLLSLSEKNAVRFLEQLRSCDLVRILCCNQNGLILFAQCYSRLEGNVKNILDVKLSIDDYRNILMNGASISGFAYLMSVATDSLREELCSILDIWPELAEVLVNKAVDEGQSIGMLNMSLRELKSDSTEALEAFEKAIGIKGYERLLENQGTVSILAYFIRYSSTKMQKDLSEMLENCPNLAEILVDRTLVKGQSIGTLDLSLRDLKDNCIETLETFERAIGIKGYERILEDQGTIPILIRLIQHSSEKMRQNLSSMLKNRPDLVDTLVQKTVTEGNSIATLNLSLRELKRESVEVLETFESAIGIKGYERLLEAQGTIPVLAHLIEHSSVGMRKELSGMFAARPDLAEILVDRTVVEGSSMGSLSLSLRELKSESIEVLEIFERTIGVKGYERLLETQGTIPVLVYLIRYSSTEMQKELSSMLKDRPELVETLTKETVIKESSLGTFNLSLRDLKRKSIETLELFESVIGVKGYEQLLEVRGTIPILIRFIQYSSPEMQKELVELLNGRPELVKILVKRTVKEGSSIGTLNVSLRALGKECDSSLSILEILIGVDGYFEMFSKCNANSIAILRIMACSSISDFLVDKMYANIDVWNESKSYIPEESHTILKEFERDLLYAKKKGRKKFWDFINDMVTIEEWLAWIKQGAILEEAVFILKDLPLSIAKNIADAWLKNNDEMMEGLRSARQHRNTIWTYESKMVNNMIMKINNYNHQLFALVNKEYNTLLENK